MDPINVKKSRLLEILKANREAHRELFEQALKGFRSEATKRLEAVLERLRQGKSVDVAVHMPVPQDHTPDYDRVVRMLELDTEDTLYLSESDFTKYVQDDWSWKRDFLQTCSGYGIAQ